jgi:hypothetical protein
MDKGFTPMQPKDSGDVRTHVLLWKHFYLSGFASAARDIVSLKVGGHIQTIPEKVYSPWWIGYVAGLRTAWGA